MYTNPPVLKIVFFVALLVELPFRSDAYAQLASRQQSLAGHRSIFVMVNLPEDDQSVQDLKLNKESLQRFIVNRLRDNGANVSTEFTDQTLILDISVDIVKVIEGGETDVYAFISLFDAVQATRLATNRQAALAATWRSTKFGAVTKRQPKLLRDSVVANVDEFLRDWRAANGQSDDPVDRPAVPNGRSASPSASPSVDTDPIDNATSQEAARPEDDDAAPAGTP